MLTERKNINKIIADSASDPSKNHFISLFILSATKVFINGNPLKCVSIFVDAVNEFVFEMILFIISDLNEEARAALLMRTAIRYALL